ncbi:MAG: hypothetical protein PF482_03145 [Desulfobacteraceae bacterium]|jgi:hypothetical protein|nr:hypothetical protein [Desulfobacteraceae bacterium]
MKPYSRNEKIIFSAFILVFFCLLVLHPENYLYASDDDAVEAYSPNSAFEEPDTETNKYFILVETRVIDAQPMDDQMLDDLSPSLIAPVEIKISALQLKQKMLQDYNHSVCFKRCHTTNDFSASDYTYEQWCILIEKDGHSIFSEIPWENPDMKDNLIKYLMSNAKNATPEPAGIGVWKY